VEAYEPLEPAAVPMYLPQSMSLAWVRFLSDDWKAALAGQTQNMEQIGWSTN